MGIGIPMACSSVWFAIGLAAFSLIVDFTSIEEGVKQGVDRRYCLDRGLRPDRHLIWLYVEILRLLAILRGQD